MAAWGYQGHLLASPQQKLLSEVTFGFLCILLPKIIPAQNPHPPTFPSSLPPPSTSAPKQSSLTTGTDHLAVTEAAGTSWSEKHRVNSER